MTWMYRIYLTFFYDKRIENIVAIARHKTKRLLCRKSQVWIPWRASITFGSNICTYWLITYRLFIASVLIKTSIATVMNNYGGYNKAYQCPHLILECWFSLWIVEVWRQSLRGKIISFSATFWKSSTGIPRAPQAQAKDTIGRLW